MKQFLPVFLFLLVTSSAWAQDRAVEGKVTALEDGQALPGVNVLVTGTSRGTATDVDGHYRLELEPGENTLQFSFIGYKTQSIAIAGRTTIDMVLELETKNLEEVVIIGYGTQNKSDLTGAVSSVRGADLTRIPALDPTMALQGKVAGVQVTSSSGAPGSQPVVRIRGVGTFNDSSPIYVVDGVIVQDIAFLNSSDIQSMEILKDASSTAIYGSRGANGVILITTKQGKKGAPTISLSGDYSIQNQQKRINLLNGQQFATVVNEINPGTYNNINAVPNTNWQNQIFRKPFWPLSNAIMNYQFSASGSSDKIQYYVGVGYFKQEGIIPKSSYERLTIRFNNTYQLSNSIRFGNNLTFAPYQQQNTNGNVVFTAYRAQPVITPYNSSDYYNPVPNVGNPLADINYTNSFSKGLRTVGNVFGEVSFLKGFTFKSSFGVDMVYNKGQDFTPVFFVSPQQQNSLSILNKSWGDRTSWLWENTLTYNKEIGKHRINALGGYTMQESTSENVKLQGRNITRDSPDFWYVNSNNIYPTANASTDTDINAVDPSQNYSMMSLLARANYTFDNRFLLTATFRRDGSSKFAKNNRYGNFPSFAAGWNVINENFMRTVTFLSNLKVRGSWGIIGNEKIDYTKQFSAVLNGIGAVFGGTLFPGQTYGVTGNPNLKWESTYQTDLGLEIGFLNDRLTIETDYYRRDTKDILIALPVPGYLGNGSGALVTYNAGEVLNRGFELTVGWKGDINKDWSYHVGANATTIYNRTLKVNGVGGSSDYLYGLFAGKAVTQTTPGAPLGSFFGYQTAGVFQNAADVAATPHLAGTVPGDLKFADTNHDGAITDADRVNLGSAIPSLLYGVNLGTSYKSFDLSMDVNGVSGNKIYNGKETIRPDLYNFEAHVWNRWTGDGTSNTEPKATSGGNNWLPSSRFIQSGAYIRLRSITLAYNLPSSFLKKGAFKSARCFLRGTNLFTHSKFTGYTPEVSGNTAPGANSTSPLVSGIDAGTYPLPAIYSVGLNMTF